MEVAAALSTMLPTGRHAVAQQLLAAHQPAAPQRGDGRPRGTVPLLEFLEAQQQAGQQSGPALQSGACCDGIREERLK